MNAKEVLQSLKEGNKRFVSDCCDRPNSNMERVKSLTGGQSPHAIILSCADSRVVPELIFDQGIGDIFVIRVAGNIANSSSIASIEYAVAHLGTKLVVVMGHESCGAVGAAVAGGDNGPNLNHLVDHIKPALNCSSHNPSDDVNATVKVNAKVNAQKLVENSEIIGKAVRENGVQIVHAYYSLSDGSVDFN